MAIPVVDPAEKSMVGRALHVAGDPIRQRGDSAATVMLMVRRRISACAPQGTLGAALTIVAGGAVKVSGANVP